MKAEQFVHIMKCLAKDTDKEVFDLRENPDNKLRGMMYGIIIEVDCRDNVKIIEEKDGSTFNWLPLTFKDMFLDTVFKEVYDFFGNKEEFGTAENYIKCHAQNSVDC